MNGTDQMAELISTIEQGRAVPNLTVEYAYVVYISGRWHPGTFTGKASACSEYIQKEHRVDLSDRSVKWARGHLGDNGTFIIHPANDRDAVHTLTQYLTRKNKR